MGTVHVQLLYVFQNYPGTYSRGFLHPDSKMNVCNTLGRVTWWKDFEFEQALRTTHQLFRSFGVRTHII